MERIVHCFLEYTNRGGTRISRAEFESNLLAKLEDPVFTQDLAPLLSSGVDWNLEEAARQIQEALLTRLPGEPWKGR